MTDDWALQAFADTQYDGFLPLANMGEFISTGTLVDLMKQTGLENSELATIWSLLDVDKNRRYDFHEYVLAIYLCDRAKNGHEIPTSLPPELVPPPMKQYEPMNTSDWPLQASANAEYGRFLALGPEDGFITSYELTEAIMQTGVTRPQGKSVWHLLDVDKNKRYDYHEYVLAMYYCGRAKAGVEIPLCLPPQLVPPPMKQYYPIKTFSEFQATSTKTA
jgi:hypothetical protein